MRLILKSHTEEQQSLLAVSSSLVNKLYLLEKDNKLLLSALVVSMFVNVLLITKTMLY